MLTGGGLDVFFEFYGLIGNTKNKNNYVSFVNRLTYRGKPVKSYTDSIHGPVRSLAEIGANC